MGHSTYTENSKLVYFKAISSHDFNGAFKIHTQSPTILDNQALNLIDSKIFTKVVSSVYKVYDKYNFKHLFWLYWYAQTSAPHNAGVQFGACIEFLQRNYLSKDGKKVIKNRNTWSSFREKSLKIISELEIDENTKNILTEKINNLNSLPQKKLLEKFLMSINITFSKIELEAWQQRNDSAHGNPVKNNNYIKLIREIKILRTLLNRLILRISQGSKYYIDYYSIGNPLRELSSSIPDDINNTAN